MCFGIRDECSWGRVLKCEVAFGHRVPIFHVIENFFQGWRPFCHLGCCKRDDSCSLRLTCTTVLIITDFNPCSAVSSEPWLVGSAAVSPQISSLVPSSCHGNPLHSFAVQYALCFWHCFSYFLRQLQNLQNFSVWPNVSSTVADGSLFDTVPGCADTQQCCAWWLTSSTAVWWSPCRC